MKTSNKILFSFLLFAWVSIMVTLLVSFRYSKLRGYARVEKTETKTWDIKSNFSVVSIEESAVVFLERKPERGIKYLSIITSHNRDKAYGDPDPFVYEVRNDTLFVKGMKQKPNGNFTIQVGAIRSILIDQVTEVRLRAMAMDSLTVKSSRGHLGLEKDHGVTHLDFEGEKDSRLQVQGIESLKLSLDHSKADLYLYLGKISGQVGNHSEVIIPTKSGEMSLTKDKSSKILVEDSY